MLLFSLCIPSKPKVQHQLMETPRISQVQVAGLRVPTPTVGVLVALLFVKLHVSS